MLVPGAIAATCPAMVMKVPAEPAQAPCGATYTSTGTRALSIAWITSLVDSTSPPGVSSWSSSASAPACSARAMPFTMWSAEAGLMEPEITTT